MKKYKYSQWNITIKERNEIVSIDVIGNWECVYGIMYDDGSVAYDNPEWLPRGLKDKIIVWVDKYCMINNIERV